MKYLILLPLIFLTGCTGGIELKKFGSDVEECPAAGSCSTDVWYGDLDDSHKLNILNLSDATARKILLKYFPTEAPTYANEPYDFKMRMAWKVPQNATVFTVTDVLFEMRFIFVGKTFRLNPDNFATETLTTNPNMYSFKYQNDVSGAFDNRFIIGGIYNPSDLTMTQSSLTYGIPVQGNSILGRIQNTVCDLLLEQTNLFPQCNSYF